MVFVCEQVNHNEDDKVENQQLHKEMREEKLNITKENKDTSKRKADVLNSIK